MRNFWVLVLNAAAFAAIALWCPASSALWCQPLWSAEVKSPASYSSPLQQVPATPTISPTPAAQLVLGDVAIGASVLDAVKRFGAPDILRTTDLGHEWQWIDATGLDREVLADDEMIVRQVLVAEPAPIAGQTPPRLVQPTEFKVLDARVDDVAGIFAAAGGNAIAESDPAVRAWHLPGGVIVAELENGVVGRLLALDDAAATQLGYVKPPKPGPTPPTYRAPVLTQDFYVPYPTAAWRANIEGTAVVRVLIDPAGVPTNAHIVVASGNAEIDSAAIESVQKSKFRPAHCGAAPCASVYFDLQEYSIIK